MTDLTPTIPLIRRDTLDPGECSKSRALRPLETLKLNQDRRRVGFDPNEMAILVNVSAGAYRLFGQQRLGWALTRAGLANRVVIRRCAGAELHEQAQELARSGRRVIGVYGGDGSARTVSLAVRGLDVAIMPLPGGTLNRLCYRVHGHACLNRTLSNLKQAQPIWLSGGRANEHVFLVASGFGPWMTLHNVRETIRRSSLFHAFAELKSLRRDLFSAGLQQPNQPASDVVIAAIGRVDTAFGLDSGMPDLETDSGLEVAQARLKSLGAAAWLAGAVLLRRWRGLANVVTRTISDGEITMGGEEIFGLVDGEPVSLGCQVKLSFLPRAALVLTTRPFSD